MKPRPQADQEEVDYFPTTPRKDQSIRWLVKLVTFLVVFMAGVVLGLSVSAHYTRHYNSRTELFFPRATYAGNCDKESLSIKRFVQPTCSMHGMSDDELFWRATVVPIMAEYPFERVPKVAFLFMAKGPLPFVPLWDRFFKGHRGLYSIYVHTLPDYKLSVPETSAFYGRQIPSQVRSLDAQLILTQSFFIR